MKNKLKQKILREYVDFTKKSIRGNNTHKDDADFVTSLCSYLDQSLQDYLAGLDPFGYPKKI